MSLQPGWVKFSNSAVQEITNQVGMPSTLELYVVQLRISCRRDEERVPKIGGFGIPFLISSSFRSFSMPIAADAGLSIVYDTKSGAHNEEMEDRCLSTFARSSNNARSAIVNLPSPIGLPGSKNDAT